MSSQIARIAGAAGAGQPLHARCEALGAALKALLRGARSGQSTPVSAPATSASASAASSSGVIVAGIPAAAPMAPLDEFAAALPQLCGALFGLDAGESLGLGANGFARSRSSSSGVNDIAVAESWLSLPSLHNNLDDYRAVRYLLRPDGPLLQLCFLVAQRQQQFGGISAASASSASRLATNSRGPASHLHFFPRAWLPRGTVENFDGGELSRQRVAPRLRAALSRPARVVRGNSASEPGGAGVLLDAWDYFFFCFAHHASTFQSAAERVGAVVVADRSDGRRGGPLHAAGAALGSARSQLSHISKSVSSGVSVVTEVLGPFAGRAEPPPTPAKERNLYNDTCLLYCQWFLPRPCLEDGDAFDRLGMSANTLSALGHAFTEIMTEFWLRCNSALSKSFICPPIQTIQAAEVLQEHLFKTWNEVVAVLKETPGKDSTAIRARLPPNAYFEMPSNAIAVRKRTEQDMAIMGAATHEFTRLAFERWRVDRRDDPIAAVVEFWLRYIRPWHSLPTLRVEELTVDVDAKSTLPKAYAHCASWAHYISSLHRGGAYAVHAAAFFRLACGFELSAGSPDLNIVARVVNIFAEERLLELPAGDPQGELPPQMLIDLGDAAKKFLGSLEAANPGLIARVRADAANTSPAEPSKSPAKPISGFTEAVGSLFGEVRSMLADGLGPSSAPQASSTAALERVVCRISDVFAVHLDDVVVVAPSSRRPQREARIETSPARRAISEDERERILLRRGIRTERLSDNADVKYIGPEGLRPIASYEVAWIVRLLYRMFGPDFSAQFRLLAHKGMLILMAILLTCVWLIWTLVALAIEADRKTGRKR